VSCYKLAIKTLPKAIKDMISSLAVSEHPNSNKVRNADSLYIIGSRSL